jgi:uncharacterized damage-inducible protein DinB
MKEPLRLKKTFSNLYNGDPWLDVTLVGTLQAISVEQASKKPAPGVNSIWEITNHLINWRQTVLERVHGTVIPSPEHNYFQPVEDTSEKAWKETLVRLSESEEAWESFLEKINEKGLNEVYPANDHTYYDHIIGIIQHDAYHLGQIVLLAKHFS